jgi:hypothetical protein
MDDLSPSQRNGYCVAVTRAGKNLKFRGGVSSSSESYIRGETAPTKDAVELPMSQDSGTKADEPPNQTPNEASYLTA